MGSRLFLGVFLEGLELISIEHVLHKMASEKNGVFVVARYKLGSRSNGNSSRSVRGGGGVGTVLVKKSDGPARLPRACDSRLKWSKSIKT